MDQETPFEKNTQSLETDKLKAKKYWRRIGVTIIIGISLLGFYKLQNLHRNDADYGAIGLIPVVMIIGVFLIFQISYALFYTFKPQVDKLSPSIKPLVNAMLTVGIWFVIGGIILILFQGK